MISTFLSRVSALLFAFAGVTFLFLPDVVLPALIPGFPPSGAWLGQLLAAAWLAIATLNWLQRSTILGGIYGRPVVMTNTTVHFITALALVRPVARGATPAVLWLLLMPATFLAAVYAWLLLRGPLERDHLAHRNAGASAF